jgi:hypothetical protein
MFQNRALWALAAGEAKHLERGRQKTMTLSANSVANLLRLARLVEFEQDPRGQSGEGDIRK